MKKWKFTLGIDVSKKTLDVHCAERNQHIRIQNGTEGFRQLLKWCKTLQIELSQSLLVMEFTGGYEYKLLQFCQSKNLYYTRLPGLAIKRSMGITRGKSDRVDAQSPNRCGALKQKFALYVI